MNCFSTDKTEKKGWFSSLFGKSEPEPKPETNEQTTEPEIRVIR